MRALLTVAVLIASVLVPRDVSAGAGGRQGADMLQSVRIWDAGMNGAELKTRIIFGTNHSIRTNRIDVLPEGRVYNLGVTTTGGISTEATLALESDGNPIMNLRHSFTKRGALCVLSGLVREKGNKFSLKLFDQKGAVSFSGTTYLGQGVLSGRWDGSYSEGKEPSYWTGSLQIFSKLKKGEFEVTFDLLGLGSESISGGLLSTETQDANGKAVLTEIRLDAVSFETERTFSTEVQFDGNPVGNVYQFDILVNDPYVRGNIKAKATIEMIQLLGEGTEPGAILGASGRGKPTGKISVGNQTQPPKLL
jgi:hypothetical protein